ncbi:MAG: hypothetical protein IPJ84_18300 [Bdellovibrionales bacterium]|nr:hypothetical protein [Bdellovibrionales bacterium]
MKSIIAATALLACSTAATAAPVLSCESSGAGGALVKNLTVERGGAQGYIVKVESYMGGGLKDVPVLSVASTPVSTKLFLNANTGAKTSLVMHDKQAVMLYEAESANDLDETGASVEFLNCK